MIMAPASELILCAVASLVTFFWITNNITRRKGRLGLFISPLYANLQSETNQTILKGKQQGIDLRPIQLTRHITEAERSLGGGF
jgi:hypothetical protein